MILGCLWGTLLKPDFPVGVSFIVPLPIKFNIIIIREKNEAWSH